jgi:hypothetical protein
MSCGITGHKSNAQAQLNWHTPVRMIISVNWAMGSPWSGYRCITADTLSSDKGIDLTNDIYFSLGDGQSSQRGFTFSSH